MSKNVLSFNRNLIFFSFAIRKEKPTANFILKMIEGKNEKRIKKKKVKCKKQKAESKKKFESRHGLHVAGHVLFYEQEYVRQIGQTSVNFFVAIEMCECKIVATFQNKIDTA